MIKKIKKMISNKNGEFSMIIVTLALTIMIAVYAVVETMSLLFTINEIRAIMDTATVSSLRYGINEDYHKDEVIGMDLNSINKDKIKEEYLRIIQSSLQGGENTTHKPALAARIPQGLNISDNDIFIHFESQTDWANTWDSGNPSPKRVDVIVVDVVATAKIVNRFPLNSTFVEKSFKRVGNVGANDKEFTIRIDNLNEGTEKDKEKYSTVIIRSVSKLILK